MTIYKKLWGSISSLGVPKSRIYEIAAHEAGHIFFIHKILKLTNAHAWISKSGGFATCDEFANSKAYNVAISNLRLPSDFWNFIKMYQAGMAAEALITKSFRIDCAQKDRDFVFNLIKKYEDNMRHWHPLYSNYGSISPAWADFANFTDFGKRLASANLDETYYILDANFGKILDITDIIFENKFISSKQIKKVLD